MQLHQIIKLPFLKATVTVRARAFPVMRDILAHREELLVDFLRSPMAVEYIAALRDYVNAQAGDDKRLLVLSLLLSQILAVSQGLAARFEADERRLEHRMVRDMIQHLKHADMDTLANWRGEQSPIGERMSPEQFDTVRDRCVAFLLDYVGREDS